MKICKEKSRGIGS